MYSKDIKGRSYKEKVNNTIKKKFKHALNTLMMFTIKIYFSYILFLFESIILLVKRYLDI